MDILNPNLIGGFTINQFCKAYGLSRSHYYNLQKTGRGPVEMRVGSRVIISFQAAMDWSKRMEVLPPEPEE